MFYIILLILSDVKTGISFRAYRFRNATHHFLAHVELLQQLVHVLNGSAAARRDSLRLDALIMSGLLRSSGVIERIIAFVLMICFRRYRLR